MIKSLAIILANGFEEVEFCLPYDLCYRAGIQIILVAVTEECQLNNGTLEVCSSHQLRLQAHITLAQFLAKAEYPDAVFLPGGMPGSKNLAENSELVNFLQEYTQTLESRQRYLAAICAAPAYVLAKACNLLGKYTCYPGDETILAENIQKQKLPQSLAIDGNIITADGVGSAHLLAEALIQRLISNSKADEVMKATLYR